jgi:hypothetical protein
MLPKIAVAVSLQRKDLLTLIGLTENHLIAYEGSEAKVTDFRKWIYAGINIARVRPELTLIVWNADQLSPECQAVLLKPMEELDDSTNLMLVVENENQLSSTILSRGVIDYLVSEKKTSESHWSEVRKCWSSGPSACIAFVDQLGKEDAVLALEEIIVKLKLGLSTEVNKKRLEILGLAIDCLYELKQTNINHKLCLDNFLISSWRMIKS